MLHRDRVRVRIVRYDRKGRPEGRVLEILERRKAPIIGRLLHEGGVWLVAPEDKRYGQDILIPKNATANAASGQVVAVELTETPSMYSQPVGRVTEVLGEIDDPGMEIEIAVRKFEVPHRFSPETLAQAATLPDHVRPADRKHRIDLTDVPLVTIDGEDARDFDDAVYCRAGQDRARQGLASGRRDRGREPLREAGRAAGQRRLRARDVGVLSAPRDPDAARAAVERAVLAEPERGPARDGVRHARQRGRRDPCVSVLSGGDLLACAADLHRSGGDPCQHARAGSRAARRVGAAPAAPARGVSRAAEGAHEARRGRLRNAPRRRSCATTTVASRRSCRASATTRTS